MTLTLNVPDTEPQLRPRITVVGVGGAGGNAVNNMIRSNLEGVEFMIANTDAQAMKQSMCEAKIQLGRNMTAGLGAGSRPDVGRAAAEEALDDILEHLDDANMVFITAGMGGGTGTGAAPVIARAAREAGMLTVGVVTKPFQFEGIHRMRIAEQGIEELTQYVDTLIIIPNQNLFRIANEKTTFADAFKMADDVLYSGVRGVTDLMVMPGLINLDFADIRTVMTEMGKAMMGTGEAEGDNRAIAAAEAAISNPLLDDVTMKGARGVLINITGGMDMTLFEVDEAANRIRDEVDPEANIIFGSTFDESLDGRMRVSVVATGIDQMVVQEPRPVNLSLVSPRGGTALRPERPAAETAAARPERAVMAEAPVEQPAAAQAAATEVGEWPSFDAPAEETPAPAAAEVERARAEADSFVAPEPVRPPKRPVFAEQRPAAKPEPFKAAEFANAAQAHGQAAAEQAGGQEKSGFRLGFGKTKRPSLFERVTGAGQSARPAQQPEPARTPSRAEPRLEPRQEPLADAAPRPATAAGRGQAAAARQASLSGLEPAERPAQSREDEDLLDIPAFLRRQAN
ncbi:cell division protein FtsZ [Tistlia consotensis]|uniref:Cell division protein FtsZ n=1 Tax=Tistlia consotensis USBA 355 TaxID=560819 RepID=A0A1Y6CJU4_9PROT|nr:cell division protein FtsZ [Tistlia consotensis]SMF71030.1 cell division protein FtsZ [Tistlia consotensis USBA 355]SNS06882.1 cell division protein FtsZ [Tistlia consotensis]